MDWPLLTLPNSYPIPPTIRTLRSADKGLLDILPSQKRLRGDRTFAVADQILWNSIPLAVRSVLSVESFKSRLKNPFHKPLNLLDIPELYWWLECCLYFDLFLFYCWLLFICMLWYLWQFITSVWWVFISNVCDLWSTSCTMQVVFKCAL